MLLSLLDSYIVGYVACGCLELFFEFFRERADRFLSHFARDEVFFFSTNPTVFYLILLGIIRGEKMKRRGIKIF